jgi:hypothetical protein
MHFEKKIKIENLRDVLPYPGRTQNDTWPGEDYHWYDFSGGVDVDDYVINGWMQDCLNSVRKELLEGKDSASSFVRSGNTAVFLFAYKNEEEEDNYSLSFNITKKCICGEISDYYPLADVEFIRVDNRDYRKEFEDKIDDLI